MSRLHPISVFFFFNDTATTEIYTLSLHDALPFSRLMEHEGIYYFFEHASGQHTLVLARGMLEEVDRKSTRLNSSHQIISYAVFCLKKKKVQEKIRLTTSN